jgi:hypothetical protein
MSFEKVSSYQYPPSPNNEELCSHLRAQCCKTFYGRNLRIVLISWSVLSWQFFKPSLIFASKASGVYYKHVTIVNDASSGVNKLKASLNDAS